MFFFLECISVLLLRLYPFFVMHSKFRQEFSQYCKYIFRRPTTSEFIFGYNLRPFLWLGNNSYLFLERSSLLRWNIFVTFQSFPSVHYTAFLGIQIYLRLLTLNGYLWCCVFKRKFIVRCTLAQSRICYERAWLVVYIYLYAFARRGGGDGRGFARAHI